MLNKKFMSIFELTLIVISSFAFAYFVSTDLPDVFEKQSSIVQYLTRPIIPVVSAAFAMSPMGCCKETTSGSTCQEISLDNKALCKTDLIGTGCSSVNDCQEGCCYDSNSGFCSINAPKGKCISGGGTWDPSATCNIPQCQVGCCILGDGAAMMTTRECTQTSEYYKMEKVFKPLDMKGTCDAYSDPADLGACLFKSDDYSNDKNCIFTTKAKCVNSGRTFMKDYLCTSKELNTTCEKTTKTSCIDGDDRVYFVDSCGNKANVYDSARVNDQNYWEKIISPKDSCSGSSESCGNCDYTTGSICTKYISGKDVFKPSFGNYVCKNLNCINGRKHGESWCVSDTNNVSQVGSPVGTRNYVASCFEGEIRIEGCADFNQEICLENYDDSLKYSEAACVINDWRSCIYANDADNYAEIEKSCNKLPQCIMFNDISGNEKYAGLPGFREDITNSAQGKAGNVGKDMNKYVAQCMPRFTPGYQFWSIISASSKKITYSNNNYGGSKTETDGICSLGTFSCVSHVITEAPLSPNKKKYDAENPECNMQAVSQSNQKVSLMMEGLNEKCRMLGSCGIQYNTQGQIGKNKATVSRIYINKEGSLRGNYTTAGYDITKDYLGNLLKNSQAAIYFGKLQTLSAITEKGNAAILEEYTEELSSDMISSGSSGSDLSGVGGEAKAEIKGFQKERDKNNRDRFGGGAGLGAINVLLAGGMTGAVIWIVNYLVVWAAKSSNMTPGETQVVSEMSYLLMTGLFWMAALTAATQGEDHEYYITTFECKAWEPPLVGKCEECNNDVRPCSENKCRSIGSNCRYYTGNGEPGYCATLADTWSATIKPWNEKLTTGNKYINVSSSGMRIVSNEDSKEVAAWKALKFGIITDEQAICKLDTNHSKKYEEMRYTMMSDKNYATGKVDGTHHWITLSPHTTFGESELDEGITTPPLEEGDNEYFIICQNFAGMTNGVPFVVQVKQKEGPDLTPADITRTTPIDKSYLSYGSTNTTFFVYVDEPAECKYSVDYDYDFYEQMPNNMSCLTGKEQSFYGEWPCMSIINNLSKDTKIFVKCKDQPGLVETELYKRNQNKRSFEYGLSVCQTGLEITSVTPTGIVDVNITQQVTLEVGTAGCVNNGEAICAFRLPYYGNSYSPFLETGKISHSQPLTDIGDGERTVDIECLDSAGNTANKSINFTVFYDDSSPNIVRVFEESGKIVLETDEEANCAININQTKQCDFNITDSSSYVTKHSISLSDNAIKQTLYIRCEDRKNNAPAGCTETIKLIGLKNEK